MTTEEYRSRYGWLAFACNAGTQLMIPVTAPRPDGKAVSGLLDNNPCQPTIHLTEDRGFQIPEEVVDAGTVCLTGVIHETASEPWIWLHYLEEEDHTLPWPEETGGTATGARIVNRCRVFAETKGRYFEEADEALHNLVEPERIRQRTEMVAAMQAVIALVYGKAV
jgi:hypothetical protein